MYTDKLVKFIIDSKLDDFPEEVVDKAKICLLDSIGCALGGSKTEIALKIFNFISLLGGNNVSTVIGTDIKTSPSLAAFANAEITNVLDYDDCFYWHPGTVVIPSAISIAEAENSSGKELLKSIICGYEVCTRISNAMYRADTMQFRKAKGDVWQIFGGITSAGSILNLDAEKFKMAFGIGGSSAPVPSDLKCALNPNNVKFGMGMVKNNYGYMSEIGVRSAILANLGYTGPKDILEGDTGFWRMIGLTEWDCEKMTEKIGTQYYILDVSFKPYPCCRSLHANIDAALNIVNKNKIDPLEINKLEVNTFSKFTNSPWDDAEPKTIGSAIHSIPFTLSCAINKIPYNWKWYDKNNLNNKRILDFAKKIHINTDENIKDKKNKHYSKVRLFYKGKIVEEIITIPRGSPNNPMSEEELKNKFLNLSKNIIGLEKSNLLIKKIEDVENIKNIRELTKFLSIT